MVHACCGSLGWLTWNGGAMANSSVDLFTDYLTRILTYNNSAGSVNVYMAHGGTNFGWWIGAVPFLLQVLQYATAIACT